MSKRSDVVIIGGGVVGLSIAWRLRQADLDVTLLERGTCGSEASWAAAGVLAPCNPHRTDPLATIHVKSIDDYPSFCAELQDVTGIDPQYHRCEALELLTTEQFVQMAKSDVRVAAERFACNGDPALELLSPEQCASSFPERLGESLGVLHCRRTAEVRSPRLVAALRSTCNRTGIDVREHTRVVSLLRSGRKVIGARTETENFHAECTVLCAGAWSSQLGSPELIELMPVLPVRGQIVLLHCDEPLFSQVINKQGTCLVPRNDGLILLGATTEPEVGFAKRVTAAGIKSLMNDALTMVPGIAEASVVSMWAGLRPGTPDARPYVGAVPGHKGLIAATGHDRCGITLTPVTAEIVSQLIVDGKTDFDLSRWAPGREQ